MIITKFVGKNIYGYLNIDIDFKKGLNFLIGSNGSGKTVAMKIIYSILNKHISEILSFNFESICLVIKKNHNSIPISINISNMNEKKLSEYLNEKLKDFPKSSLFNNSELNYDYLIDKYYDKQNKKIDSMFLNTLNKYFSEINKSIFIDDLNSFSVLLPSNKTVYIHKLSEGEYRLFFLLLFLYINKKNNGGIIFIDDPELHIHIHWQNTIIKTLLSTNSKSQYIIATHSPDIIQDYQDRCILIKC